jgi:TolA-binding protein
MVTRTGVLLSGALALSGCLTLEDGEKLRAELRELKTLGAKNELRAAELATQMDEQLKRLHEVVDEATKVVTRNSADVGGKVDKLVLDVSQLSSRLDELERSQDAITKQFQDYRANSEGKLEQLSSAMNTQKAPPLPETADGIFAEGEKRLGASQWLDARRAFDAFILRFPADPRAAKAQFLVGDSYAAEKRWPNAIQAYKKVIDFFPKSELVPDAMFKSGQGFYALKYCGDAKIYFQELLRRYPKTGLKQQVNDELKRLAKDAKDKNVCSS